MSTFGVVLLPNYALQAALRHRGLDGVLASVPVAVLDEERGAKPAILEVNDAGLAAGVQVGMTSSQGLARCAGLALLTRSPAQEKVLTDILLQSAFACSPWVEATAASLCTFELREPRNLASSLAEQTVARLAALKLAAQVGIAANPDLARLAAHGARPCLLVTDARAFLSALPVGVLEPTPPVLAILRRWGVETLGALGGLPRQEITRRLGTEGHDLCQRATGRTQRLLRLVSPPVTYEESMDFEHEVQTLEPLLFVLRRFLDQLVLRLAASYRVPAALDLWLGFDDGQEHCRSFSIPAPTGDVEVLFRVIHTHLENFVAPSPVRSLRLAATPALPAREQFGLFETALRDPNRFSETLARLHALLGPERAGVARCEDTHRPDSFHLEVPDFLHLTETIPKTTVGIADSPSFGLPLRRLRPPLALRVEVSRRVPVRVESAQARGEVRVARGPYCLLGGWWETGGWAVEEWDVELAHGGLYRLSRHLEGWFLEGAYD